MLHWKWFKDYDDQVLLKHTYAIHEMLLSLNPSPDEAVNLSVIAILNHEQATDNLLVGLLSVIIIKYLLLHNVTRLDLIVMPFRITFHYAAHALKILIELNPALLRDMYFEVPFPILYSSLGTHHHHPNPHELQEAQGPRH